MRIVGGEWTKIINYLFIRCKCNKEFKVRVDRWIIRCPGCGKSENIGVLRDRYMYEGGTDVLFNKIESESKGKEK